MEVAALRITACSNMLPTKMIKIELLLRHEKLWLSAWDILKKWILFIFYKLSLTTVIWVPVHQTCYLHSHGSHIAGCDSAQNVNVCEQLHCSSFCTRQTWLTIFKKHCRLEMYVITMHHRVTEVLYQESILINSPRRHFFSKSSSVCMSL